MILEASSLAHVAASSLHALRHAIESVAAALLSKPRCSGPNWHREPSDPTEVLLVQTRDLGGLCL